MAVVDIVSQGINTTETTQQVATLAEQTNRALLKIIRDNFNTQYATQALSLSGFRDAVSAHGGTEVDATLLADFRTRVPLSNYDCYKPFADKFNVQPCKKEEVENLFAPGLPDFLAASSGTSGPTSKIVPKYDHNANSPLPRCPFFDPNDKKPLAAVQYCGYMDIKEIGDASRIPICIVSSGTMRRCLGWKIEDDKRRMSIKSTFCPPTLDDTHSCLRPSSAILCCAMGSDHHRPCSILPHDSRPLLPYPSGPGPFLCTVRDGVRRSHSLHRRTVGYPRILHKGWRPT